MQEERFTFSEIDLAAAIRSLREALGRSPEVMAQILGCTLPAYQKWEIGRDTPSGEWLIRLLQLCPNEEIRNEFRIRAERRSAPRNKPKTELLGKTPLTPAERYHYQKIAHQAVDAICECGQAGTQAADKRLVDFAENLQAAAHYYLTHLKASFTSGSSS